MTTECHNPPGFMSQMVQREAKVRMCMSLLYHLADSAIAHLDDVDAT